MKYKIGFILGRETSLSVAEIAAVLSRENIKWQTEFFIPPVFIVTADDSKLSDISINSLGGTIKIFEVFGKMDGSKVLDEIKKWQLPQNDKRINFGLSFYGLRPIRNLGQSLKEHFLNTGLKARHVVGRDKDLSSVIVHENKLIERGFEAVIVRDSSLVILGRTKEVQDYKFYSKRDFGRPARDDRSGMLPPKLAQMMINLAEKNIEAEIYDPFCGSGTIIQEALILGYKNLFGTDKSDKAVTDTRANLNWIEQFGFSKTGNEKIMKMDILNPQKKILVDAIITEGYLGKPINRTPETAGQDVKELATFYLSALKNMKNMLNKDGVVVIAIPFFIVGKERFFLPLLSELPSIGYKLSYPVSPAQYSERKTLTYIRSDQFVGREILVLKSY